MASSCSLCVTHVLRVAKVVKHECVAVGRRAGDLLERSTNAAIDLTESRAASQPYCRFVSVFVYPVW